MITVFRAARCATRRQCPPSTRPANWCSFLQRLQRKHADIPQILRQRLCPRRACVSKINIDIWSRASSASGGGAQAREASPMRLPRRKLLHLAAGAAALPAVSRVAWAQSYPARPVRIIVGFAPSGATDIMARLIGQWLSERLSQQFIIENRPGAGSNVATEAVVRAPPDGYTLLLVDVPNAINATLYDRLNFNFIRDIVPVASISRQPQVMVVNLSVAAKTVPEFIAYAKANPGKINMASGGN